MRGYNGYVKEPAVSSYVDDPKGSQPQDELRPRRSSQRVGALSLKERRSAELRRLRRMRLSKIVHSLGERPVFEAFDKLANDFDESVVDHLLERLANIDPAALRALGGDKLPVLPVHVVGRAQ